MIVYRLTDDPVCAHVHACPLLVCTCSVVSVAVKQFTAREILDHVAVGDHNLGDDDRGRDDDGSGDDGGDQWEYCSGDHNGGRGDHSFGDGDRGGDCYVSEARL